VGPPLESITSEGIPLLSTARLGSWLRPGKHRYGFSPQVVDLVQFSSKMRMAPMYIVMYTRDMLQRYSIAEARAHLPRIVDQAEAGIEVELTRRGRAVAVLVSRQKFDRLRGKGLHFRETYRKFLEKYSVKGIGLEDDLVLSLRDKSTGRKVSL